MPTMRSIQCERYGPPADVLRLEEVEVPEPREGEVLLRVHAASANPVEWHLVRGEPFLVRLIAGLRRPKDTNVGGDVAGVVEVAGPGVTHLAPGDAVFGTAHGSFAELACAKVDRLARKPQAMTFEEAASIPVAGCTALQALRDHGRVQADQRVLVIGAAGRVVSRKKGRRVATFIAKVRTPDLEALAALVEEGRMRPAVERTYPLAEAAAALTAIESGHATGKLVVAIRA